MIPGRWWRRSRASRWEKSQGSDSGPSSRRDTILFYAAVLGGIAAIIGIVSAVVFYGGKVIDLFDGDDGYGGGRIEVSQVNVKNLQESVTLVDGRAVQAAASLPAIDVTVRNTGTGSVLLTQARVTIEDSARFSYCPFGGGADIPASPPYLVLLPVMPRPEEQVRRRPLHEEVPVGGFDRFVLQFGIIPSDGLTDHLYALHVELLTDRPQQTVDVGRFLLGVPDTLARHGLLFPENRLVFENLAQPFERPRRLATVWCYRRNVAELRRLLRTPGRRSPEVKALSRLHLVPGWEDAVEGKTPRQAAEALLRSDEYEAPTLAVFAAELTDDEAFTEATRMQAAAELMERAEEEMARGSIGAALDARRVLAILPSPQAQSLWERAEARMREIEVEIEEEAAEIAEEAGQ